MRLFCFFGTIKTMEIIRATVLGFCFGVRRAVELAEKALTENSGKNVYSLGPLIHNELVLNELSSKGLLIVNENEIEKIENGSIVIIRAHGVEPSVEKKLVEKNCRIINATCPRVTASQKMVSKYNSRKDFIILTGDKNHGEVISIAGYAGNNFILVQNLKEAENLKFTDSNDFNFILMSQTTFCVNEFEKIKNCLEKKCRNLTVLNTICPATKERQDSLIDLCSKVDGVLIIGGKNSANTKRLYELAQENSTKAVFVQSAQEIPEQFYTFEKVGITAGASTPDQLITEVEATLHGENRATAL